MALTDKDRRIVEELTKERDRYRRLTEKLRRQMAKRTDAANAARAAKAEDHAREVARIIHKIVREQPKTGTDGIAAELERRKIKTARGSSRWSRAQVHRVMQRAGEW